MPGTALLPDGLAGMPAGAELAAVLHRLSLDMVPNDRMLDMVRAQYRQLSHEQARMAATLVELGRCDPFPEPGAVSRSDGPEEFAPHETRAALRWTRNAAEAEHGLSEAVVAVPVLFAAWDAGLIDRQRVLVFDTYLTGLTAEQVSAVCAKAVPRAPGMTTGQLRALLQRLVIEVDPDAAARWYRRGVRERTVHAYLAPDGTVTIAAAGLPPDEAEAACKRVEALAHRVKRAGHPGRVGQIRSDVFLGLLDGRFHGLTDDGIVAALMATPRRPEDTADLVIVDTDDDPAGTTAGGTNASDPSGATDPACVVEPPPAVGPAGAADRAHDPHFSPGRAAVVGSESGGGRSDGPAATGDRRRGIEIRATLSTVLELDDRPGEIPGLGPVLATRVRARVAMQTAGHWRFAVVDAAGRLLSEGFLRCRPAGASRDGPPGGVVEIQIDEATLVRLVREPVIAGAWAAVVAEVAAKHARYAEESRELDARPVDRFPGGPLRRHTEIRDRTCTLAGVCRRPAHASEQDHGYEYTAGGATVRQNVGPVCRTDHQLKHRAGWVASRPDDPGTVVWRSPLGGVYSATGEFLTAPVLGPVPGPASQPELELPDRFAGEPILRRPPVPETPDAADDPGGRPEPADLPDDPPF